MIKILLVSGNKEYISTLENEIINHKKLDLIAVATNEKDALSLIANKNPDIVVINADIPSSDWLHIIQNKPIFILLSGERKALVLDNGKYEIKSFDINALLNIVDSKETKLENISNMLNNIGINSTTKGHHYLVDILSMILNDGEFKLFEEILYPAIAEKYNVTTSSVERCIRYVIELMWKNVPTEYLEDYFGISIKKKPTNKEFVEIACNELRKNISRKDIKAAIKIPQQYRLSRGGSFCIPSYLRKILNINSGDQVELIMMKDNIVIKKC